MQQTKTTKQVFYIWRATTNVHNSNATVFFTTETLEFNDYSLYTCYCPAYNSESNVDINELFDILLIGTDEI